MIIDDLHSLFKLIRAKKSGKFLRKALGVTYKWERTHLIKTRNSFILDLKFVSGLRALGYDLKLVKIANKKFVKQIARGDTHGKSVSVYVNARDLREKICEIASKENQTMSQVCRNIINEHYSGKINDFRFVPNPDDMILDQIHNLLIALDKVIIQKEIGRYFNRGKAWVCTHIKYMPDIVLDADFANGFNKLGYDIKLVKYRR